MVGIDPAYVGGTVSQIPMSMIYQQLVTFTPEVKLKPVLATSWEANDKVWTFQLRRGVMFHDGTPFNAAAVKAHFDRLLGPERPTGRGSFAPVVAAVDAVGEYTIRFTTNSPEAFFLELLAEGAPSFIPSPAATAKFGKDLTRNPVGTGPFRFVEWVKDDRIVVERFDGYWGEKAFLDRVVIRPVPEAQARAIGIERGDVQLAIRLNPEQLDGLRQNPRVRLSEKLSSRTLFMGMANLKKPFSDVRVRQALNYAIDKETIAKNLYLGQAEPLPGALARGASGYAEVPGFPYDQARAKRLLAEAGYPNGFTTKLVGPKGTYVKDFELQQAVQQQLRQVGVNVTLETLEYAKWLEQLALDPRTTPLEMWQDAAGGINPVSAIDGRYGCTRFRPTAGFNTAGACIPRVDALIKEAALTIDVAKRNALLKEAQELLTQDAPSLWLVQVKETAAMNAKLHDPVHLWNTVLTVDERTWLEP
ncbi:MAG: hypothetical protein FJ034_07985 [Chloroflexi bacterium]|nr:hypothetical protein [Chloroflexota bacterium]